MLALNPISARPISVAQESPVMGVLGGAGAFVLSGQAAGLRVGRRLIAAAATFLFAGESVQFLVTVSPVALGHITLFGTTSTLASRNNMRSNFAMVAGDTKGLVISVTDAAGSPVNITGATIAWHAAKSFRKTAIITKAVGSGVAITDGPNGVFTVQLDAADTEDLVGDFLHEAQIIVGGEISTVIQGTMKINRAVIRA